MTKLGIKTNLLLTFLVCMLGTSISCNTNEMPVKDTSLAKKLSKEFSLVAKGAIPAVVSIRSQMTSKSFFSSQDQDMEDGLSDPMEDFLKRFFGAPPYQQKPEKRRPRIGLGSGFVVSKDGYIMTNNHVIENSEEITVHFNNGKDYIATLVGSDPNTDFALLKIDAQNLPYLTLGNSDDVEIGEFVLAIGSPLELQATVTLGIISAKGRNDLDITPVEEFIQTDAAINPGNSGGCLLNLDGEVIGMNTAIASNAGGGSIGIGFAIPSNLLKRVMNQILEHGKVIRGFLGVSLQKIDNDLAKAFNLETPEGALISDVVKDSPADQAGLKDGDIVLKINGELVENAGSLRNKVSLLSPGQKVVLTIKRNDTLIDIPVTIGTHPQNVSGKESIQNSLGIIVQEITPEMAQRLGIVEKGVLIKSVDQNSLAYDAGIRPNHLILSVNRKPVTTPDEFYQAVKESNNQVLLQVKAGPYVRYITLKLR